MELTHESYRTVRVRSNAQPEKLGDIIEELLDEMATAAEHRAGEIRGAVRPEQRQASQDLDLLCWIQESE